MKTVALIITGLMLSMAQFSQASDELIPVEQIVKVRQQQVVAEVRKQIKNKDTVIGIALADKDFQSHGVQGVDALEVSNYQSARTGSSFEERDYLVSVKTMAVHYCAGDCNEIETTSFMISCHLRAKDYGTKAVTINCEPQK
ncbi:hypothetical protein [Bdellovibrio svalbardensis]|uniref:Secreted protein n=1 Tax=Bdellovibrio svalbardensis TaxID=2972972 RepID=A0ABT6DMD0_9BACT|nr:hypothetical protein [Bdellovibrio svalbardensis]MDG0817806.1 hypothetical protein [Bdellovibrio svalbardensis]